MGVDRQRKLPSEIRSEDTNAGRRRNEGRCWFGPQIEDRFAKYNAWYEDTVIQSRAFCFPFVEDNWRTHLGLCFDVQQLSRGGIRIGDSEQVFTATEDTRPQPDGMDYM